MLMAKLLQELKRHGKIHFELVFLVMNPGYNADNWKIIQDNAELLGIPLTVFESDIFDTVAEIENNPVCENETWLSVFSCQGAGM
jgi:tRNA 2-thiocytidine biosynthesis protein TtcA